MTLYDLPITIDAYPFMVSIWKLQYGHICGGALISYQHAVTAAHCVDCPNALNILEVSNFQRLWELNHVKCFGRHKVVENLP